jgi:menaquinone-dependent protoporphyrinogen oxidase
MARILVLYGTTDGHTARIADVLATAMRVHGADVQLADAAKASPSPDAFDAVVIAASVHAGGYQRAVKRWVRTHAALLSSRPTAFVSVCLGVLQHVPAVDRELTAITESFLAGTGWSPGVKKVVAGALPYTKYNWLKRLVMKRIVRKAGGDVDTSRDHEYTDWDDLRRFAGRFVAMVDQPLATPVW